MDRLASLTPREFEELVAAYLRDRKFAGVQVVGASGDRGVDIRCRDEHGRPVVVQCKHYTAGAKIGAPEIRTFFGVVIHAKAASGIFATSASFTAQARQHAVETDIELIDGAELASWLNIRRPLPRPAPLPPAPAASTTRFGGWHRRAAIGAAALLAICTLLTIIGAMVEDEPDPTPTRRSARSAQVAAPTATPPARPSPTATVSAAVVPTGTAPAAATTTPTVGATATTARATATRTGPAVPTATKVPVVNAGGLVFYVVGAQMAPMFSSPLDLERLDDGRSYLLVSVRIVNTGGDSKRLDSDDFTVLIDGERVQEAGDVVDGAADALDLRSMGDMVGTTLDSGDGEVFLFAYKVAPKADTYAFAIDHGNDPTIDLAPWLGERVAVAALVPSPTPKPTQTPMPPPTAIPTPRPTRTPTPTPVVPEGIPSNAVEARVVEVIDGDTIAVEIAGRRDTVRLIGMDTPETRDPDDPVECFGAEATGRTTGKIPPGTTVWLERDVSERDQYDRLLRYVWYVREETGRAYMVNERLVAEGYAVIDTYPPDVKYVDRFTRMQDLAQGEQRGLWPACGGADTPLAPPTPTPVPPPPAPPAEPPPSGQGEGLGVASGAGCDPSYPGVCIPPYPPDLDCPEVGYSNFQVVQPDPHGFDRDVDGIGCEG